jgi:hypothetical protein
VQRGQHTVDIVKGPLTAQSPEPVEGGIAPCCSASSSSLQTASIS